MSVVRKLWAPTIVVCAGVLAIALAYNRPSTRSVLLQSSELNHIHGKLQAWFMTLRTHGMIEDYVAADQLRKLQIGSGNNALDGWLNTDIAIGPGIAYLDAAKQFPFEDGSFHYVYSEHVIEHLTQEQGMTMLNECYRILAPGGKIRVATPDLARFARLFDRDLTPEKQLFMEEKISSFGWPRTGNPAAIIMNLQMRSWGHVFLYDVETLRDALELAGFENIESADVGESSSPHLQGLELRTRPIDVYETMILEGAKPER